MTSQGERAYIGITIEGTVKSLCSFLPFYVEKKLSYLVKVSKIFPNKNWLSMFRKYELSNVNVADSVYHCFL